MRLLEELGLEVEETPPYKVFLGDEQKKATQGCCNGVPLTWKKWRSRKDSIFLS